MSDRYSAPEERARPVPRFQFSLATLMIAATTVSVLCALAATWPYVVIPVFLVTAGPVTGLASMKEVAVRMPHLGDATLWSGVVTSLVWASCGGITAAVNHSAYSNSLDAIFVVWGYFLGGGVIGFYTGIFLGAGSVFLMSPFAFCWRRVWRWAWTERTG